MKKVILIIISVIIFLAALVILLPNVLGLFSKDIAPIDDSDLQLSEVFVPPAEENSFYDVANLKFNLEYTNFETINNILAGKEWDENLVAKILTDNKEALDVFDRMSKKTVFQDPNFALPEKISILTSIVSISSIRSAAKISALKAMKLAKDGRGEDAFNEAIKSLEIGQKIESSQSPLIYSLVAVALKHIGLDAMEYIVAISDIPPEKADDLEKFKENKEWMAMAFKIEYKSAIESVNLVVTGEWGEGFDTGIPKFSPVKNNFYFKPNKTKRIFADYTRSFIAASKEPCGSENILEIKALTPESKIKMFFTENLIGKILHDMVAVSYSSVYKKSCDIDSRIVSVQELLKQ